MGFPDATKEYPKAYETSAFPEYGGMTCEEASREASHIIKRDGWYCAFPRLAALREIMKRTAKAEAAPEIVDMFSDKFAEREAINDAVRSAPPLSALYPQEADKH